MKKPFTCTCGQRTTAPFFVNGQYFCTLCAEDIAPWLVGKRASRDWNEFINQKPRLGGRFPKRDNQYDPF